MALTDAHCHKACGESRCFLCSPFALPKPPGAIVFHGAHPWYLDEFDERRLRSLLAEDHSAGVGEIGLDRLKERAVSPRMREVFARQLEIAADFARPVVLHGAKCWGEVAKACIPFVGAIPAFLFHGFSRAEGLLPDIERMNGYISIGPALLNDHAVNYRKLAKKIPTHMLLVETDRTSQSPEDLPSVDSIAAKLAELRGVAFDGLSAVLEENASRFCAPLALEGQI